MQNIPGVFIMLLNQAPVENTRKESEVMESLQEVTEEITTDLHIKD